MAVNFGLDVKSNWLCNRICSISLKCEYKTRNSQVYNKSIKANINSINRLIQKRLFTFFLSLFHVFARSFHVSAPPFKWQPDFFTCFICLMWRSRAAQTPSYLSSYNSAFGGVGASSSPSAAGAYPSAYATPYNSVAAQSFTNSQQIPTVCCRDFSFFILL